jgi:hypothetical protein
MSKDPVKADNAVITKLATMYFFLPFLWDLGVSRKTESPYSAMKRLIPVVLAGKYPLRSIIIGV